jgi:hypothetical protein
MATLVDGYIPNGIVNNITIDNATLKKIISRDPPEKCIAKCNVTLLADMAHDKLSTENQTTPNDLENNIVSNTSITVLDTPIVDILSTYGECVVYSADGDGYAKIPYSIPDNNKECFIRDCFAGRWIPGLNNVFDQAGSSLGEFIKYHNITPSNSLKNPLLDSSPGGIGQQDGDNRLKFTAYFNYDLLLFLYITTHFKSIIEPIVTKVQGILNETLQINLYPNEILLINTVNINFVWCWLMIYCKKSVEQDEYYSTQADKQTGFKDALHALTQIRFDSFDTNNDGYISNPFFYYRGTPSTIILKGVFNNFKQYIDEMCSIIYNSETGIWGNVNADTNQLAGGQQYITSQAMAATCIGQLLKFGKGIICRNSGIDDPVKTGSSDEINSLFSKLNMSNTSKAYGWSILKFSGDSSHIVFGEIMEKIKEWDTTRTYLPADFKIIYAISERPLAARLLAVSKTVYLSMTDVFMNNFDGKGSENKSDPHAALYIEFDKSHGYKASIDGLFKKIKLVFEDKDSKYIDSRKSLNFVTQFGGETNDERQERSTRLTNRNKDKEAKKLERGARLTERNKAKEAAAAVASLYDASDEDAAASDEEADTLATENEKKAFESNELTNTAEKLGAINKLLDSQLPLDHSTDADYDAFQNKLNENLQIKDFLKTFEIDTLVINIEQEIPENREYFNDLAKNMISQRWSYGFRSKTKTNWFHVMNSLNSSKQSDGEIFRKMQKIVNMFTNYYVINVDKTEGKILDENAELFKRVYIPASPFKTVFDKIISANGNADKMNQFKENRIKDYYEKGSNSGDNIPPQMISIIDELDSFVHNCFKLKDVMPISITSQMAGGDITTGIQTEDEKQFLAAEHAKQTEQDIVQVLSEIPYFDEDATADNKYLYLITDLIALINDSIDSNFYTLNGVVDHIRTKYPDILASRLKSLCGIIHILAGGEESFEQVVADEKKYLDNALTYIFGNISYENGPSIFDNKLAEVITSLGNINDMRTIMRKNIEIINSSVTNKPIANKQLIDTISGGGPLSSMIDINNNNITGIQTHIIQSLIGAFPNVWYDLHNYIDDENIVTLIRNYKDEVAMNEINQEINEEYRQKFKEYLYHILYTIEQLSIDNGQILGVDTTDIDDPKYNSQVKLCLQNRTWISRMISALGLMEPSKILETRDSRHIRINMFFTSVTTKITTIRMEGGKKTRKKRRIQTKRTKKRRYVTKTAHKKKTKNANRSKKNKTRRKRHY